MESDLQPPEFESRNGEATEALEEAVAEALDLEVFTEDEGEAEPVFRFHLVLFQGGRSTLEIPLVQLIRNELDEAIDTPPELTEIDVWLDSPGGDANAAYKLFLDLRSRCRKLRAVVPDYAKSAATLFLLGVDEIYMGAAAELGPLDVQIEHPDREGMRVSGLDVTNSLEFLVDAAFRAVLGGGAEVIKYTRLARPIVLHETFQFTAKMFEPLMSKLDPTLLHKASQELQVAEDYAVRMLAGRNVEDEYALTRKQARHLLTHLVAHYPVHGFIISRDEAKKMRLPVFDLDEYFRDLYVLALHNRFIEDDKSVLDILSEDDLVQLENEARLAHAEEDPHAALSQNGSDERDTETDPSPSAAPADENGGEAQGE